MTDRVFFYGTLMSGFRRPGRERIESKLDPEGRGWIRGALFDLGIYPAAIPASDGRVRGEIHRMTDPDVVLRVLDDIEGYSASEPDASLYTRAETPVTGRSSVPGFGAPPTHPIGAGPLSFTCDA